MRTATAQSKVQSRYLRIQVTRVNTATSLDTRTRPSVCGAVAIWSTEMSSQVETFHLHSRSLPFNAQFVTPPRVHFLRRMWQIHMQNHLSVTHIAPSPAHTNPTAMPVSAPSTVPYICAFWSPSYRHHKRRAHWLSTVWDMLGTHLAYSRNVVYIEYRSPRTINNFQHAL